LARSLYRSTLVFSFVCSQMLNVVYILICIYCFVASEVHVLEYCFNLIPRYYITITKPENQVIFFRGLMDIFLNFVIQVFSVIFN
jgi:hypothetical protein